MVDYNKILQGDVLDELKKMPDESIDMQITSPPYWALRDYGADGQIGLEKTFQEYLEKLIVIFKEVKRVLKPTGTCWVNLGDTYWGGGNNRGSTEENLSEKQFSNRGARGQVQIEWDKSYKRKCLCGIPMRFALMMIDDGWILRNTIIWHKPNAMPTPTKDRYSVDFEYLFFFTKNEDYYFEQQLEPHKLESIKRACRGRTSKKLDDGQYATSYKQEYQGYDNMMDRLKNGEIRGVGANGRNKRTVWTIPTKGFSGAHFAIFPEELIESPVKAGCPKDGVVMDIFFGSGTTGVVALKNSKKFLGIELNPEYVKIAEERLKPFLIQTKLSEEVKQEAMQSEARHSSQA